MLPDLDFFFSKKMNDHRNTLFHTPFTWIVLFMIFYFFSKIFKYPDIFYAGLVFTVSVLFHLFLDWFSGRITGIRVLYPFSTKNFSAFAVDHQKGDIKTSIHSLGYYLKYFRHYAKKQTAFYYRSWYNSGWFSFIYFRQFLLTLSR